MVDPAFCTTMAAYNRWMNERIYDLCAELTDEQRRRDQGAFFGSIHRTLDHLVWADRVWLSRFTGRERPAARLGETLFTEFPALREARVATDAEIEAWARGLDREALADSLSWTSGADGGRRTRPLWVLAVHLFNHQTHHRGQVTALLTRLGVDPGVTDLPWMPGLAAADG